MQAALSDDQLRSLREGRIIEQNEIAYKNGDLLIAENVLTKQTRIIGQASNVLAEANKRLLKG
jgi:hypothetical protein